MRYMMIVKATPSSERGVMPTPEQFACMGAYNELLSKAGVLVDLSGLQATAHGMRIRFDGGKKTVLDGPFTESKELIAGYWIINVKSPEEAREWALKAPNPSIFDDEPGEIELRRFFEPEDFGSEALEALKDFEYPSQLKRP